MGGVGIIDWAAFVLLIGQHGCYQLGGDVAQVGNKLRASYRGRLGRSEGFIGWVSPRFGQCWGPFGGIHMGGDEPGGVQLVFTQFQVVTWHGD